MNLNNDGGRKFISTMYMKAGCITWNIAVAGEVESLLMTTLQRTADFP